MCLKVLLFLFKEKKRCALKVETSHNAPKWKEQLKTGQSPWQSIMKKKEIKGF